MGNIVSFSGANLPSAATLTSALRGISNEVGGGGSDVILKMDKAGYWVYGAEATEVQEGSVWAVNPLSFVHGYVAWGEGEKLGEKLAPVTQPLPDVGEAPPGAKRGWELQLGFSLRCMSGEDEGLEARFCVSSVGGRRAVVKLGTDIAGQVEKEQSKGSDQAIVPLVVLETDHYQHKSYGRIFTPVFAIQRWVPMSGPAKEPDEATNDAPAPAAAEAPAEEPVRRRRRPAAAA